VVTVFFILVSDLAEPLFGSCSVTDLQFKWEGSPQLLAKKQYRQSAVAPTPVRMYKSDEQTTSQIERIFDCGMQYRSPSSTVIIPTVDANLCAKKVWATYPGAGNGLHSFAAASIGDGGLGEEAARRELTLFRPVNHSVLERRAERAGPIFIEICVNRRLPACSHKVAVRRDRTIGQWHRFIIRFLHKGTAHDWRSSVYVAAAH
jgi:hypothetical protein